MTLLGNLLIGSTTIATIIVISIAVFGKRKHKPVIDKHKALSTYEDTI